MISVICPTYNEADSIEKVIEFFIKAKPGDKELLIIDGGSEDGTVEIVKRWSEKHSNIKLINNKKKYVPFALNLGVKQSAGDPVIRIDAHSIFAEDYFERIIETFEKTGADIVGGPTRINAETDFQKAVGYAISNSLGVGNSKVHDENFEGYVDHVTFGAWRKKIFDEIGYFDERLIRNQDDEFHYRANSMGKKVYLNPLIKLWYSPRKNFKGLFKQYFQYGYYKPLVLQKIKSEMKLRHIVPSLFVVYILSFPAAIWSLAWLIPLFLYFLIILSVTLNLKLNLKGKLLSFAVYPAIHIAYGSGFLLKLLGVKITS